MPSFRFLGTKIGLPANKMNGSQQPYRLPSSVHGFSHGLTKNTDTQKGIGIFYGVDNGIRTHDLQSHNLTR